MDVVDLSELAACIFTQLTARLQTLPLPEGDPQLPLPPPRAVLVVPADATPGRVLRRGHLLKTRRPALGQVWVHSRDSFHPEYKRFPVQVYALGPAEPEV